MIRRLFSSQLRINMVSGVAVTLVNVSVMAVAYPIYLHFLGYEQYGVWLVLTTVLTFAHLGNLGVSQAVTKLVAEEYGRGDMLAIQQYLTTAMVLLCLSGLLVLVVLVGLRGAIIPAFRLTEDNARTVSWLLPYIGGLSIYVFVTEVLQGTLSGLGRMDLANGIHSLGGVLKLAVAGPLLFAGFGIESLLVAAVASRLAMHVASLVCVRRIVPFRIVRFENLDARRGKSLLSFGGGVFAGSLVNMLFSPFNRLILARYVGLETLPVYEIAHTGSMQVRGLVEAALRALMPEISRVGANTTVQAKNRISQINTRAIKVIVLFGVPVYVSLIVFARPLLSAWLGGRFTDALPDILRIMLVGTFFSLLCVPAYYTLMGLGRVRHCFLSHVIQGVVNAGAVGMIVLSGGAISVRSVALAVVAAMGATSSYVVWQARRTMRRFGHGGSEEDSRPREGATPVPACSAIAEV